MNLGKNRWKWFGVLGLVAIVLLTLLMAPRSNLQVRGSTFSRTPDGYGAWFAYMQQQGTSVQRWHQPLSELVAQHTTKTTPPENTPKPATLLQVNSQLDLDPSLDATAINWLKQGNTLIILGVRDSVTEAPFSTKQESAQGDVKIETTRRHLLKHAEKLLLGDRFGATVWEQSFDKGHVIFSTTPHLAANAYQDAPGNFAFLAELTKQNGKQVWVDEYLHGYQEAGATSPTKQNKPNSWVAYLAKTPFTLIGIQLGVLLLLLIWAQNRRFGSPVPLVTPKVDNSEAYIQALANVLHKAGRSEFVLDMVSKAEQLQIQQALGLGTTLLDPEIILLAWKQQSDRPTTDLEKVLKPPFKHRRISERNLLTWLEALQSVRQQLS